MLKAEQLLRYWPRFCRKAGVYLCVVVGFVLDHGLVLVGWRFGQLWAPFEQDSVLLLLEQFLNVFELVGAQVVVVDDFQVLGVLVVLASAGMLLLGTVVLDVGSQDSHFLLEVIGVVKVVELRQSELAVVVVQALLGNVDHFGCVLEVEAFSD